MASVDAIERAEAPGRTTTAGIWGEDVESQSSKARRRRLVVCAGVSVACVAVFALAFGLSGSLANRGEDDGGVSAQSSGAQAQMDHNALGCFKDRLDDRTLRFELSDPVDMTPEVRVNAVS